MRALLVVMMLALFGGGDAFAKDAALVHFRGEEAKSPTHTTTRAKRTAQAKPKKKARRHTTKHKAHRSKAKPKTKSHKASTKKADATDPRTEVRPMP